MSQASTFVRRADHGARILVVDDDPMARLTLRAMLERSHYLVETAESGEEALALLSTFMPDLVLLDIIMPGLDGLETCRRIRNIPACDLLPVILLTADERPEIHAEAFRARGDDFLRKPLHAGELVVRIRSLMRLKRLQGEIQAERDALLDLQSQREQLFHFIVHDLKNPLATLQLGLDRLATQEGRPEPAQLDRLRDTAGYMGRMIQTILDLGEAEERGLDLAPDRIDLAGWLPQVLQDVQGHADRLGHTLAWSCEPGLALAADPALLRRLLVNLVDNALKFGPAKGRTEVRALAVPGGVRLEVADQGPGIPEALRERIFGKFVRLEDRRAGSGLGLAFCRAVAEAHGGRIWVQAQEPAGSVFCLELSNLPVQ